VGRKAGITEDQLRDLAVFETSPHFDETEKLVLRLSVELTRTPAKVPNELYAALRARFSEAALVELNAAICWENYRARFNRTFEIEPEGFSEGQYCPLPEPGTLHQRVL
jgi:alkylhydroperoxidase family enzyme